jgi:hypothetical protein
MILKRGSLLGKLVVGAALGVSLCGGVIAHGGGGGRGGDSGDSSMNPYTGDSYAYFHGGHNLGEQGMNIPWRSPDPKSASSTDRNASNATAKSPSTTTSGPTRAFQSVDSSRDDQRTDMQQGGKRQ